MSEVEQRNARGKQHIINDGIDTITHNFINGKATEEDIDTYIGSQDPGQIERLYKRVERYKEMSGLNYRPLFMGLIGADSYTKGLILYTSYKMLNSEEKPVLLGEIDIAIKNQVTLAYLYDLIETANREGF